MLWDTVRRGLVVTGKVPFDRWDADASMLLTQTTGRQAQQAMAYGGFVDDLDLFDARMFHISEAEALAMDPQQRLLLEYALLAFADAGYFKASLQDMNVGIFVGICSSDVAQIAMSNETSSVYSANAWSHSTAVGRVSYVFGLRGPSVAFDTACSSSLVALHAAARSLQHRECDLAMVAGVNAM